MSKLVNWISANTRKMPADYQRTGLGLWFQIIEERFMPLFRVNLVTVLWLFPCFICLFFYTQLWDWLSGLAALLFFTAAGPGIAAMHFVCMKIVRRIPVWWWEDYRSSVKRDWKQAMLFSAIIGILINGYVYAVRLVVLTDGGLNEIMLVLFILVGFVLIGFAAIGYQQLANVELSFRYVLKNAFLLQIAGGKNSFFAILFAFVCAAAAAKFYSYTPFALLVGLYAIAVMSFELIFLPVFERFFPEDEE